MTASGSEFDEFGVKVKRAQHEVAGIRGVGTVDGITVEVDAENRLAAIVHPDAQSIMAAYHAALRDKQPQVDAAMRDVLSDPQAQAVTTFVHNNNEREDTRRQSVANSDEPYFERFRNDPLGRNHGPAQR